MVVNLQDAKSWAIHEGGMIGQAITDITDSSVRLFTETARIHNQAIQDAKQAQA